MVVLVVTLSLLLIIVTSYLLYYKSQIKEIGNQLAFISKHHSFKFIQSQIKPKEISHLIDVCNRLLHNQRELKQQFIHKNEEINTTIVSLSHDIRTPLTSLDGYLQLAERIEDTRERNHYIKQAQSRMDQINGLVDELFLYTRLENKDYVLDLESIDIANALKKSLLGFFNDFSQSGVEPNIDLPESPVYISGNSSAIDRVFENIIKNYFFHGEGELNIWYEERKHEVRLHFQNALKEGKSIDLHHIFTRFYKEDVSRTGHSSGLGLYIVKSLMERMQGDVTADMERSQFCLRLVFNKNDREKHHGG
ncbi:sensor histidine kinase [Virgibacillus oceani]